MAQAPGFYRFKIGSFDVVALHEGVLVRDRPAGFVRNASDEEVGEAFATAGMARDKLTLTFNALVVDTGKGVVLIDTGLGDNGAPTTGALIGNLEAAGIAPEDVSTVFISHFHGDHIGGIRRKDGTANFPNAELVVPAPEWAFWMDQAQMSGAADAMKPHFAMCHTMFDPVAKDVRQIAYGAEIVPGLTAVDIHGHTPGMAGVRITDGSDAMLFVADVTNNPLIFARHPEWQAMFDMDPLAATASRKKILDMAAADKLRVSFYHAPFPATGFIAKNGPGYEFLPALWSAS
jgi:glyoxylase-like metal-dependent hydrolase (beta-lactamase superfamily II)